MSKDIPHEDIVKCDGCLLGSYPFETNVVALRSSVVLPHLIGQAPLICRMIRLMRTSFGGVTGQDQKVCKVVRSCGAWNICPNASTSELRPFSYTRTSLKRNAISCKPSASVHLLLQPLQRSYVGRNSESIVGVLAKWALPLPPLVEGVMMISSSRDCLILAFRRIYPSVKQGHARARESVRAPPGRGAGPLRPLE